MHMMMIVMEMMIASYTDDDDHHHQALAGRRGLDGIIVQIHLHTPRFVPADEN